MVIREGWVFLMSEAPLHSEGWRKEKVGCYDEVVAQRSKRRIA